MGKKKKRKKMKKKTVCKYLLNFVRFTIEHEELIRRRKKKRKKLHSNIFKRFFKEKLLTIICTALETILAYDFKHLRGFSPTKWRY